MTDNSEIQETATPSGVAVSRPCSKCKSNPRRGNSSWCNKCINEQAADYRDRTRPVTRTEERQCAWEDCSESFTWRSTHPRQVCCSKAHYSRYRWRLNNPRTEVEQLPEGCKKCCKCERIRGVSDFSPSQWLKGSGQCRDCWREYSKAWSKENKDRRSAATRRARSKALLRKYGAPSEDFDELLEAQGGVCGCCGGERGQNMWHIDHDHSKPEEQSYRALLCHGCNVGLGAFADDPSKLQLAMDYLEKHG